VTPLLILLVAYGWVLRFRATEPGAIAGLLAHLGLLIEATAGRQGFEIRELVLGALLDRRDPEVEGGLHERDDDRNRGGVNRSSRSIRSSSGRFSRLPETPWSTKVSTRVQPRCSMKVRASSL
jgi:hypothetical protein